MILPLKVIATMPTFYLWPLSRIIFSVIYIPQKRSFPVLLLLFLLCWCLLLMFHVVFTVPNCTLSLRFSHINRHCRSVCQR